MAREKHILAADERDEEGRDALLSSPKKERGSFLSSLSTLVISRGTHVYIS